MKYVGGDEIDGRVMNLDERQMTDSMARGHRRSDRGRRKRMGKWSGS